MELRCDKSQCFILKEGVSPSKVCAINSLLSLSWCVCCLSPCMYVGALFPSIVLSFLSFSLNAFSYFSVFLALCFSLRTNTV